MWSIIKHKYSDSEYVRGMKSGDRKVQNHFYTHCKENFDANYSSMFFVDTDKKEDIFEDSFIILWQKIEHGDLYVCEGKILAKSGKRLKCALTTFLMSIAWNKFREYTRRNKELLIEDIFDRPERIIGKIPDTIKEQPEEMKFEIISTCLAKMPQRCNQILTMFYFERKDLDAIMIELKTYTSKNALKTAKHKCYSTLKHNVLQQYRQTLNV